MQRVKFVFMANRGIKEVKMLGCECTSTECDYLWYEAKRHDAQCSL